MATIETLGTEIATLLAKLDTIQRPSLKGKATTLTAVRVPCLGEAHKNPHIDHCGVCMPFWGSYPICGACNRKLVEKAGYLKCPGCNKRYI